MWHSMIGYYRRRNEHRSLAWAINKEREWDLIKPKEEEYDEEEEEEGGEEAAGDAPAEGGGDDEEEEWARTAPENSPLPKIDRMPWFEQFSW